jgi:hypothetical protein
MRSAVRAVLPLLLGGLVVLAASGCGGGGEGSTTAEGEASTPAELTPDDVGANLQDAGYQVGNVITHGGNEGVAQNGRLDADASLSVDYDPDGQQVYASVYFFSDDRDAKTLADEYAKEDDEYDAAALQGTRVYHISGTQQQLDGIVAAAEGD